MVYFGNIYILACRTPLNRPTAACQCNVKLGKLLSTHKSHVRETSLLTGAIPNPVRNSQTSRFVSVPGQNPGRSSRGDSSLYIDCVVFNHNRICLYYQTAMCRLKGNWTKQSDRRPQCKCLQFRHSTSV